MAVCGQLSTLSFTLSGSVGKASVVVMVVVASCGEKTPQRARARGLCVAAPNVPARAHIL